MLFQHFHYNNASHHLLTQHHTVSKSQAYLQSILAYESQVACSLTVLNESGELTLPFEHHVETSPNNNQDHILQSLPHEDASPVWITPQITHPLNKLHQPDATQQLRK